MLRRIPLYIVVLRTLMLGALFSAPWTLYAQDVQFLASVDRTEIPLGQQFQVTFTLSGGNLKRYTDFRAPDMNRDFLTLAGPSTSQSMQIINNRVSSSISWTFVLQGRKTGAFTLPAASLNYDGSTLRTNTIRITITRSAPQSTPQGQQRSGDRSLDLGDNLFVRAIPNKTTVYQGEPILVTYKMYSRVAFQLDSPFRLPRMIGFWSEDVEAPRQLHPRIEVLNGKQYETYMLRKVLYFPTQSGTLSIDPFEIGVTVRARKRRNTGDEFFDRFFSDPYFDSYENVKKSLLTDKITVRVKPLPEQGRPASFTGVVGSFTMDASIDRDQLRTNETATLKVVLKGKGNIRLLDPPVPSFPSGIDHYDPTISENVQFAQASMSGSKTFDYLLVPRFPGSAVIPPIEFSYFDPEKQRYVTLNSGQFTLQIEEGEAMRQPGAVEQRMIDYLAQDVYPPKAAPARIRKEQAQGFSTVTTTAMFAMPWLAMLAALAWKRRHDRIHGDVMGLKRRRATRIAEKHLSMSRSWLEKGSVDSYYLEIARALWGYMQDALGLPTSQTTVAAVTDRLRMSELPEETVERVRQALDAVDYARFSPTRADEAEMRGLFEKSREAIIETEQYLKERKR
jgi:hypothetical protein